MTTNYQIIFRGQALSGFAIEQLKINVAKLYNTEVTNIESLFSGSVVVIKDNLDEATALKYAQVFRKQGALCEVRNKSLVDNSPVASLEAENKETQEAASVKVVHAEKVTIVESANPEQTVDKISAAAKCTVVLDDYIGSMTDISVAESGSTLVELKQPEEPNINIGNFEIAEAGEALVEFKPIEEPEISIDNLTLAPTGTDFTD